MSNPGTGTGTGASGSAEAGSAARAGGDVARTPALDAIADAVRDAVTAAEAENPDRDRWDDDDLPGEEAVPDLGELDDDEPQAAEADERPVIRRPQPDIRLWHEGDHLTWETRASAITVLDDDDLAVAVALREERLTQFAAGLVDRVLSIDDVTAMWEELRVSTAQEFQKDSNTKGGSVSGDRWLLVGLPSGRMLPLAFFFWKRSSDKLVAEIAGLPGLASITLLEAKKQLRPVNPDSIGQYFGWIRAARAHPHVVARHRALFRLFPAQYKRILDSFADELQTAAAERATAEGRPGDVMLHERRLPVLYRALAGGLS